MRERGIPMSAPMVRALLERRKWQTRRLMQPQPHPDFLARGVYAVVPQWPKADGVRWFMLDGMSELVKCPYGKPGDGLYVREKWAYEYRQGHPGGWLHYAADGARENTTVYIALRRPVHGPVGDTDGVWRPSTNMPRWASRLTMPIAAIRAERLQDITAEDAIAEGLVAWHGGWLGAPNAAHGPMCFRSPRAAFRDLWQSLNGARSPWDRNDWVWVVEWKEIHGAEAR